MFIQAIDRSLHIIDHLHGVIRLVAHLFQHATQILLHHLQVHSHVTDLVVAVCDRISAISGEIAVRDLLEHVACNGKWI